MALQLTPDQKERLLAARTYLLAQMMEIIQERTLIIAMLQVQFLPQKTCHVCGYTALSVHVPAVMLVLCQAGPRVDLQALRSWLHVCVSMLKPLFASLRCEQVN